MDALFEEDLEAHERWKNKERKRKYERLISDFPDMSINEYHENLGDPDQVVGVNKMVK